MIDHTQQLERARFAAETGDVQWFKDQKSAGFLPQMVVSFPDEYFPFQEAAQNGHLEVIKWFVSKVSQFIEVVTGCNVAICYAASAGHLNILEYIVNESGQNVNLSVSDNYAICYAAKNGHFDVVRWLVADAPQKIDLTAGNSRPLYTAALNGHLDIVRYLIEESGQEIDVISSNSTIFKHVLQRGQPNVVVYLQEVRAFLEVSDLATLRQAARVFTDFKGVTALYNDLGPEAFQEALEMLPNRQVSAKRLINKL